MIKLDSLSSVFEVKRYSDLGLISHIGYVISEDIKGYFQFRHDPDPEDLKYSKEVKDEKLIDQISQSSNYLGGKPFDNNKPVYEGQFCQYTQEYVPNGWVQSELSKIIKEHLEHGVENEPNMIDFIQFGRETGSFDLNCDEGLVGPSEHFYDHNKSDSSLGTEVGKNNIGYAVIDTVVGEDIDWSFRINTETDKNTQGVEKKELISNLHNLLQLASKFRRIEWKVWHLIDVQEYYQFSTDGIKTLSDELHKKINGKFPDLSTETVTDYELFLLYQRNFFLKYWLNYQQDYESLQKCFRRQLDIVVQNCLENIERAKRFNELPIDYSIKQDSDIYKRITSDLRIDFDQIFDFPQFTLFFNLSENEISYETDSNRFIEELNQSSSNFVFELPINSLIKIKNALFQVSQIDSKETREKKLNSLIEIFSNYTTIEKKEIEDLTKKVLKKLQLE